MRVQQSGVLEKVARIEAEPKERADGTTSGPRESGNASRESSKPRSASGVR